MHGNAPKLSPFLCINIQEDINVANNAFNKTVIK